MPEVINGEENFKYNWNGMPNTSINGILKTNFESLRNYKGIKKNCEVKKETTKLL